MLVSFGFIFIVFLLLRSRMGFSPPRGQEGPCARFSPPAGEQEGALGALLVSRVETKKGHCCEAMPFSFLYFYEPSMCPLNISTFLVCVSALRQRPFGLFTVFVPGLTPALREGSAYRRLSSSLPHIPITVDTAKRAIIIIFISLILSFNLKTILQIIYTTFSYLF